MRRREKHHRPSLWLCLNCTESLRELRPVDGAGGPTDALSAAQALRHPWCCFLSCPNGNSFLGLPFSGMRTLLPTAIVTSEYLVLGKSRGVGNKGRNSFSTVKRGWPVHRMYRKAGCPLGEERVLGRLMPTSQCFLLKVRICFNPIYHHPRPWKRKIMVLGQWGWGLSLCNQLWMKPLRLPVVSVGEHWYL